jgi:hypothetical protein
MQSHTVLINAWEVHIILGYFSSLIGKSKSILTADNDIYPPKVKAVCMVPLLLRPFSV